MAVIDYTAMKDYIVHRRTRFGGSIGQVIKLTDEQAYGSPDVPSSANYVEAGFIAPVGVVPPVAPDTPRLPTVAPSAPAVGEGKGNADKGSGDKPA